MGVNFLIYEHTRVPLSCHLGHEELQYWCFLKKTIRLSYFDAIKMKVDKIPFLNKSQWFLGILLFSKSYESWNKRSLWISQYPSAKHVYNKIVFSCIYYLYENYCPRIVKALIITYVKFLSIYLIGIQE